MTAIRPMLTRTCRPLALATALALAALTTLTVPAHAADECGALDPANDAGRSITCTTTTFTPDTDKNGVDNIFYEIGDWTNPADGNYTFTIHGDLTIRGRRSNKGQARDQYNTDTHRAPASNDPQENFKVLLAPGQPDTVIYDSDTVGSDDTGSDAPQDDHGRRNYRPNGVLTDHKTRYVSGSPPSTRYGGVFIDTHHEFDGTITLRSEATITVDHEPFSTPDSALRSQRREGFTADGSATGISVLHHGRSGNLDLTIGGAITSPGEGVRAEIDPLADSVQNSTFKDPQFMGNIGIRLLPGVTITTSWEDGDGIQAWHRGTGDVTLTAAIPALAATPNIATAGHDASGISAEAAGYWNMDAGDVTKGNIDIDLTNIFIRTTGGFGTTSGRDFGAPRDADWEGSRGFKLYSFNQGNIDLALTGSRVETRGVRGQGIYALHFADGANPEGDITIDLATTAITTAGNYADGILAYHGSKGLVDINLRRGSTVTTTGTDAHAIAGLHHGTDDVRITLTDSTITTSGAGADGLRGGHRGDGDVRIDLTDSTITTTGAEADGIFAFHLGTVTVTRGGDGAGNLTRHAQHTPQSATASDSGPWGLFAEPGATPDSGDPPPTLTVAVKSSQITATQGQYADAVRFEGAKGILTLEDSTLAGGIRFAAGDHDDSLTITQTARSGRYDGTIAFLGGTDTLALDIAAGRSFVFAGAIDGLETLTKTGGGLARLAGGDLFLNDLHLKDGTLVLTDALYASATTVTIDPKGRLVLEAGLDTNDQLTYGQIASGTVHFAGTPEVFLQLSPDLTPGEITAVRTELASEVDGDKLTLIQGSATRPGATNDADPVPLKLEDIMVKSTQADGTDLTIGRLDATGVLTTGQDAEDNPLPFDATRIAQLVVPASTDPVDPDSSDSMDPGDGDDSTPTPQTDTQSPPPPPDSSTPTTPSGGGGGGGGGSSPPSDPAATDAGDTTTPAIPGVADTTQVTWLTNQAAPPPASHTLAAALPAVLLDLLPGPAADTPRLRTGPGSWVSLQGASLDRERTDATVPVAYSLDRRGVALGHELATGPAGTLGVTLHHQTGRATVSDGGTIDVAATTLGLRHAWDLAPVTLTVAASATTLASDLAGGLDATGLDATGLTITVGAAHRRALAADATLTLGGGLTHARVAADGFATAATPQVTDLKGDATTLALTADWSRPRSTGAVFAGARLALPLDGDTRARIGTTALTSAPRPTLGLEAGLELDGATLALGYARASGGDSLGVRLGVAF